MLEKSSADSKDVRLGSIFIYQSPMNESVNAYLAIYSGLRPPFIGKSHTKECTILRPSKRCADHETRTVSTMKLLKPGG